MIKFSLLTLGVILSVSSFSQMNSRWILKVASDTEQWPNVEITEVVKKSISACEVVVDEIMPMGVPGFYRFSVTDDLSQKQQDCIMSIDMVLSLTADGVMRRAKPDS